MYFLISNVNKVYTNYKIVSFLQQTIQNDDENKNVVKLHKHNLSSLAWNTGIA